MNAWAWLLLASVVIFAPSGRAAADGQPTPRSQFAAMREQAINDTEVVFDTDLKRFEGARAKPGPMVGTQRSKALEPENAAATADRLTAALKTGLAGTEAGVSVAPFGLKDPEAGQGFNLTLAALEKEITRIGASYSIDLTPALLSPSDIGLAVCKFDEKARKELNDSLDALAKSFEAVCRTVAPLISEPEAKDEHGKPNSGPLIEWHSARVACGLEKSDPLLNPGPEHGLRLTLALVNLVSAIQYEGGRKGHRAPEKLREFEAAVKERETDIASLRVFDLPTGESCYTDKQLETKFLQKRWETRKTRLGFSLVGEFFPRKEGFNPDASTPLPKGQASKWQGRAEISIEQRQTNVTLGLGVGKSREDLKSPLRRFLSPAFSISRGALSLSSDPVVKDDQLNVKNGKIPPSLVIGLNVGAEIALEKPSSQTSRFNKFEIMPFADFKISDKLSVRLGLPYKGAIQVRKADEAKGITENRGLQRSLPFSILSVIKL